MTLRIASFDIGKVNFAQCIEETDEHLLEKLSEKYHNLPKKLQRRIKGPFTPEIKEILDELASCSKITHFGVFDLRYDKESNNLDVKTRLNIIKHLESFDYLWEDCDIIIIEQQYFNALGRRKNNGTIEKAGGVNADALKIAEIVMAWFLMMHPTKEIISYGSRFKTEILGSPKEINTKEKRKKWTTQKFQEISESRHDENIIPLFNLINQVKGKRHKTTTDNFESFFTPFEGKNEDVQRLATQIIRDRQKMDDISDTVMQCQAYKFMKFIAKI